MSYDCCQVCGKPADAPHTMMNESCEKPECPGTRRNNFFKSFLSKRNIEDPDRLTKHDAEVWNKALEEALAATEPKGELK